MERLTENLFTTIAKIIAVSKIKKTKAKDDPELIASIESIRYHAQRLQKIMKMLCDRDPQNPKCKKGK